METEKKQAFIEQILTEWEHLRSQRHDVSLWDAFVSLVKDKVPVYLITLRADIDIIKHIAQGYNIPAIHRMTGIPSKEIREVAFTWGLEPLETTLDFNALLMYNSGMTADILYARMNDFMASPLSFDVYEEVIHNIERYYDLEKFLLEEEESRHVIG